MLISLSIRNYALITSLDVRFNKGLNMITGETGAGKSILLGALSLLMGNRADTQVLKDKEQKCTVEASFDVTDIDIRDAFSRYDLDFENQAIFRREITPLGKTRAFINDTPVNLSILREIGSRLVDIHSQHQNLLISDSSYALHTLDQFARLQSRLEDYSLVYNRYRELKSTIRHRMEALKRAKSDQDYLEFQLSQLEEAKLMPDEQDQLEQEQSVLEHSGEIQQRLSEAVQILNESENSLLTQLKQLVTGLNSISPFLSEIEDPVLRFQASYIELQELSRELIHLSGKIDSDPIRLQTIIDRLDIINGLERKHQVNSINELLALEKDYRDKLNAIQSSDDEIEVLQKELTGVTVKLSSLAEELTNARLLAIPDFQTQVGQLIRDLGMPNGRFEIHHDHLDDFSADGSDTVRFWFSANKNHPPEELSLVASGGETSRLMLSLKSLISNSLEIPTVIFDEIDSGVSGDIADKVGNMIGRIAIGRQVLNITHLPQVASKGDFHYKVFKYDDADASHTTIKLLSEEERVTELAQMLSGQNITPEAIQNARVLLNR